MDSTQYAAAVADNVRHSITAAGRSVLSIAEETGIPRTTLDRRLRSRGTSPFTVTELSAIANALGTTTTTLTTVDAGRAA